MNIDLLRKLCLGDVIDTIVLTEKLTGEKFNWDKGYLYKDNNSKILAVAHLDTVSDLNSKWTKWAKNYKVPRVKFQIKGTRVTSISLDDRLGVFVILDLLKEREIVTDYLFTTDEESCASTADLFEIPKEKEYNWIFEFDRRGSGVVLYQYDDKETRDLLTPFGYKIEHGSFSDISCLEFLGIKCFNFGVGYHFEHSENCMTDLSTVRKNVNRFVRFYNQYKNKKLSHTPYKHSYSSYLYDDYYGRDYMNTPYRSQDRFDSLKNEHEIEFICNRCGLVTPIAELYCGLCFDCADYFSWDETVIHQFNKGVEFLDEEEKKKYLDLFGDI